MWNRADPIDGRLTIGTDAGPALQDVPRHVVGVVADVQETDAQTLRPNRSFTCRSRRSRTR